MAICMEVWGDNACFSRPEMKVERVSYDVMTPSAARGILESVFWHPGLVWRVDRIRVCAPFQAPDSQENPIQFTNLRRNEVKAVASARSARTVMEQGKGEIYLNTRAEIQQRAAMLLKNVHYVIEAHFDMTNRAAPSDNPGKFQEMATRRLQKGQCFHQPYLGSREFPASFRLCTELPPCPEALRGELDLGWMLYDMDYSDPENIRPRFFRAKLRDGVLEVPAWDSGEVLE